MMFFSDIPVRWQLKEGFFSLASQTFSLFALKDFSGRVELNGKKFSLSETVSVDDFVRDPDWDAHEEFIIFNHVRWIWKAKQEGNSVLLETWLVNQGAETLKLDDWNVLYGGEKSITLPANPEEVRFFGWNPWNIAVEDFAESEEKQYNSTTLLNLSSAESRQTLLVAFVSLDRMSSYCRIVRNQGKIQEVCCSCSGAGYHLRPGQTLKAETLRIGYFYTPESALATWAEEVNFRYQPDFTGTAGVTLGTSAWSDLFTTNKYDLADELGSVTSFTDDNLKEFHLKSIHGGTHYAMKGGLPGNWMKFESTRNGQSYEDIWKNLFKKGWTFKMWFSPFWFFGEAEETLEENRENLLQDLTGNPVVLNFETGWEFGRGKFGEERLHQYFLDGTHPHTKEYLKKVFSYYRTFGVRAYMMDFLFILPDTKAYDETKLPIETSRSLFQTIREAAGRDTHIQTAVASSPCFIGCVNSARVVRDFGETRPQAPFPNWQNSSYCMHDEHFSNIFSFMQNASASWFTNRKVYVNDLNALTIDEPIPVNFAQMVVTMFGLAGDSPMAADDDLRNLAPERMKLFKLLLPRTGGYPEPVDLFDRTTERGGCHLLKKHIRTSWDEYVLLALFQSLPEGGTYETEIDFSRLGLEPGKKYVVYEFWNQEYLGIYKKSFFASVPEGSCKLFRISEARTYPWLISTTMHIEQGNAEIEALDWNEDMLTLTGTARRPAGESGRILLLMPRDLKLKEHHSANTMKDVTDMQTIVSFPIRFKEEKMELTIAFERHASDMVARPGWLPYTSESEWLAWLKNHPSTPQNRIIE